MSQKYKEQFRQQLFELYPSSILDVGCGGGDLLRSLQTQGVRAIGLEPSQSLQELWRKKRIDVRLGHAEKIPLEDNSVDYVVCEFSLHHFRSVSAFFSEALRVCRSGLLCLDTWYDLSISSQQVAWEFDRIVKRIDRSVGEVHWDSLNLLDVVEALRPISNCKISRSEYWLDLRDLPQTKYRDWREEALQKCGYSDAVEHELKWIDEQIELHGISDDGAMFIHVSKAKNG